MFTSILEFLGVFFISIGVVKAVWVAILYFKQRKG